MSRCVAHAPTHSVWATDTVTTAAILQCSAALLLAFSAGCGSSQSASATAGQSDPAAADHAPCEITDPVEGGASPRPLSPSELLGCLRAVNAGGRAEQIFEGGDAIHALAEEAIGAGPIAKAQSVVEHVGARRAAGAFEPWSFSTPRDTEVLGAERTAGRLAGEEEAAHLYPLEVALATTVALREAGVEAMVAELWSFPGAAAPPDPSGRFGYFGVAVYGGAPEEKPALFDPYGGRDEMPGEDFRVLSDPQVAGAFLSTEALRLHVHEGELTEARARVRKALRLDPRAPHVRSVKLAISLASGGAVQEALDELNEVVEIRPDPPRRNLLAAFLLAMGDFDGARRQVSLALEEAPELADAYATQAALHMVDSDLDAALAALEAAERFDPELVNLQMLWAQYYLQTRDLRRAVAHALRAVERRPGDWQERLRAAQVFRAANEWNEMRRQAHLILELAPSDREEAIADQIIQVLGDTAFEEVEGEPLDPADFEDDDAAPGD